MPCLPYYTGIADPMNIVFFLINITCAMVSIAGNSLTIFVVATRRNLQTPQNLLLMALSITDLLAGSIPQPIYGTYLSFFYSAKNCVLEKSVVFMSAASCAASLLLLCVIARDRYLHVAKGLQYNQHTNRCQITLLVVGCWTISLLVASTFMVTGEILEYLGFSTFSAVQLFSFLYIVVIYGRIQRKVSNHYKRVRMMTAADSMPATQTASDLRRESSHNKTLLMLILLFVVVWFPFMIILIIGTVYQARRERPGPWLQTGFVWTAILTYVNGAINPLIYAVRYRDIGFEMRKLVRKMLCGFLPAPAVGDSTTMSTQA